MLSAGPLPVVLFWEVLKILIEDPPPGSAPLEALLGSQPLPFSLFPVPVPAEDAPLPHTSANMRFCAST